MKTKIEIIKFGNISEGDEGRIVFKGFNINGDNKLTPEETILTAVIERLTNELDLIRKEDSDETVLG